MNFIISGRNIDITPGLRQAVEQKLGKLEKYFTPETDIIGYTQCRKRTSENRSYDPCKRKHYPFRAGKQRYVCIH